MAVWKLRNRFEDAAGNPAFGEDVGQMHAGNPESFSGRFMSPAAAAENVPGLLNLGRAIRDCFGG